VDPDAAVEAAGVSLRIALRSGLIARGRLVTALPALPAPVETTRAATHAALREHLAFDLAMIEARHTMATPGTQAHLAACSAARSHCTRPRPDLSAPLQALLDAVTAARPRELMTWTTEQSGALLAEVEHLRRMTQLVPRLDAALERMLLPDPALAPVRVAAATPPPALAPGALVNRP
jgi:transposase